VADPALSFRPLGRPDFPLLVTWLARAHVAEWWGDPLDVAGVEAEFGPCIDGTDPTLVSICLIDDTPIGLVQIYRLADEPDYQRAVGVADGAGLDLFIGELERCGQGWGSRIVSGALDMIWERYPEVRRAMAGPSIRNLRSQHVFEKAGLRALRQVSVPDEPEDEMILVGERPTTR
jgi:aminoglycoside 6'-N-acetyltransferase